jgi:hypothetical protein
MIIPFWADVDTTNGGNVYYRETTDSSLLEKAKQEVIRAFPGTSNNLSLEWLFIVTWDNVAFFGSQNNCSGTNFRNSFQTILATSVDSKSFVIFNFNRIDWTTGTASGGDCFGQGGQPAKSGFDVGDGINFFSLPGSCSSSISNVIDTTNVNRNGQWIFRVDQNFDDPSTNGTEVEPTAEALPVDDASCNPNDCTLSGYCYNYKACNPLTRTYRTWTCSEGLFWNPHNSTTSGNFTSPGNSSTSETCHGSCDVWDNLAEGTKSEYRSDQNCFSQCFYAPLEDCGSSYLFHGHGQDGREVETVSCPIDIRRGRHVPLVWVQERESCDFCYNVRRSSGNGTCCQKYDQGEVHEGGGVRPINNSTGGGGFNNGTVFNNATGRVLIFPASSSNINQLSFDYKKKV